MKNRNISYIIILVFVILGLLVSCKDPTTPTPTPSNIYNMYYTVTFDANGGSPVPKPQTFSTSSFPRLIVKPSEPIRDGYMFGGWFKESAFINEWNFATDSIDGNLTLYARWDVLITVPEGTLAAKLQWISTNAASNSAYVLEISSSEALTHQNLYYGGKTNITILLKSIGSGQKVISLSDKGSLFSLENRVTLILEENLVLQGKTDNNNFLVSIGSNCRMIMNGGKISGNTGGGVCVGGVGIGRLSDFTMNGGEIYGNTVTSSSSKGGGGVYINEGGFSMNGGEIYGNSISSPSSYGGGVYVTCRGVFFGSTLFNKTGGTIYGYTAGDSKSNVVKDSNVIQNNRGHAVYIDNSTSSFIKRKETTAGPLNNLSYDSGSYTVSSEGAHIFTPTWDGAWDY